MGEPGAAAAAQATGDWRDPAERALARARPLAAIALVVIVGVLLYRAVKEGADQRADTRFYVRGAERFVAAEHLYVFQDPTGAPIGNTGYTYPPPFAAACTWTLLLPYRAVRVIWLLLMTTAAFAATVLAMHWLREGRAMDAAAVD